MKKIVAYIDVLGFSNYVMSGIGDAIMVLTNANAIIDQLIFEQSIHPPTDYPLALQNLALRTSITSVEDYLPFSDSVFITARDASEFVMQLSHFLGSAFLFTARTYAMAADKSDPTKTQVITPMLDSSGHVVASTTDIHVPPVLFRGGIAFGEVERITPTALVNGKREKMWSLAGEAVVRAVKFDGPFKGPRIFFGRDVYNLLNAKARLYCREIPERNESYEILWPATHYILENPCEGEFHYFYEYMDAAYNLWKVFAMDEKVGPQYEKFMEVIIASTLQVYDQHWDQKKYAVGRITQYLQQRALLPMFRDLLS